MKRLITPLLAIALATIFSLSVKAQNLVPNGSFEQYSNCPDNTSEVDSCIGWLNVLNTPDYFNTCASYPVGIPSNFVGYQYPFEGNAYIGLATFVAWTFWREIVGVQLIDAMIAGSIYNVSMRVSRGNWTDQNYNVSASNKIGMRFTTYSNSLSNSPAINNYAQVYTDSIINDTINWVLLNWNYIPDSAYTHVYIGNFFTDSATSSITDSGFLAQYGMAYYFVDSINIICLSDKCLTAIDEPDNKDGFMVFNQNTRILDLMGYRKGSVTLSIINSNGQLVWNSNINTADSNSINLAGLSSGFYIAMLKTEDKISIKKIIII